MPANIIYTLASLKRIAKANIRYSAVKLQATIAPANYTKLIVRYSKDLEFLQLNRRALSYILAAYI